jgi:thymidylate synthase
MDQYHNLLRHILKNGKIKKNRTGVDTISTFGYQNRYDLSKSFPLITTKKVGFKTIMRELL